MSFARLRQNLVVFVMMTLMVLHPSSSYVPSTSTRNRQIPLDSRRQGQISLVPSQAMRRAAAAPESASSSPEPLPQLVPSQVLASAVQLKRQTSRTNLSQRKMLAESDNNAIFEVASSSTEGSSKTKRKRRRTRQKHMTKNESKKNGKNRRRRVLIGNLPDIHWYEKYSYVCVAIVTRSRLLHESHPTNTGEQSQWITCVCTHCL